MRSYSNFTVLLMGVTLALASCGDNSGSGKSDEKQTAAASVPAKSNSKVVSKIKQPTKHKDPTKQEPSDKGAATQPLPLQENVDLTDFERLDFATALALASPGIEAKFEGTRIIYEPEVNQQREVDHNWTVKIPYLGYQRIPAWTYLNGKQIDAVNLYLAPDLSDDTVRTYEYENYGNLSGNSFVLRLSLVHNRAAGECEIKFYRYNFWWAGEMSTLPSEKVYRKKKKCPVTDSSLQSELAFSRPGWKLSGSAQYSSTFWGTTFPAVELWITEYELMQPRIMLTKAGAMYADIVLSLDLKASSQNIRIYRHGPDADGRKVLLRKQIDTQQCFFEYTDNGFGQGIRLSGTCGSIAE